MILIVESGATKSDWRIISEAEKSEVGHILTKGLNVSAMSLDKVAEIIKTALKEISLITNEPIKRVYIYIAGVTTETSRSTLVELLQKYIAPNIKIEIETDLMAAARGTLGLLPGFVGILGTGSNTCYYDGRQIADKVNSGGYIIGDEGSAATLGRLFISDYIKGLIPESVTKDFQEKFISDYAGIVEKVYKSEAPSKYLGSLAPFILEHYEDPYIRKLVDNNFRNFFKRSLMPLISRNKPRQCSITNKLTVGIVGGFGIACQDIIKRIAEEEGVLINSFQASPIDGLIKYHLSY